MLETELAAGRKLVEQLAQLAKSAPLASRSRSEKQLAFTRAATSWNVSTAEKILSNLGADPHSRFTYMYQLFSDELREPGGSITDTLVSTLRSIVDFVETLDERLKPEHFSRPFDWSRPINEKSPTPTLAQVEAKRWEFCEALLSDAQKAAPGTLNPLDTAARIGLHAFHAREFFASLVRLGRLRRDSFTEEWKEIALSVDAEDTVRIEPSDSRPAVSLRVFLCHASEDKAAVRELSKYLEQLGHSPWLDESKLLPGQDWNLAIRKAMTDSDVVLVCLSENSSKRGYVQKEVKRALDIADEFPEGSIFLIPVRLAKCPVPDQLVKWQWVDLFEPNGPDRLAAALLYRAEQ